MEWFTDHSLLWLLAAAAVFTAAWLTAERRRLDMKPGWAVVLGLLHVAVGVGCVKVFAVLEAGSLEAAGNMSLFGAVFFLPLFYWLGARLAKRPCAPVFDLFTVPTVFTLACARVNCLLTGCCQGRIIPGTQSRWPTREAELVFYAVLLVWLYRRRRRENGGILWPVYMAAYGAFRFVTEFFRESSAGGLLHLSHLWAGLSLITGLSIAAELRRRNKQVNSQNHRKLEEHRRKHK